MAFAHDTPFPDIPGKPNIPLAFAMALVLARLCTLFMHHPFFVADENFGYYLLSYRLAFTPRALVGTIADLLRTYAGLGFKAFFLLCFGFSAACMLGACAGAVALLNNLRSRNFAWLFGVFILAVPSTFHAASLKTSFDIFTLAGFVLSAVCIRRRWPLATLPVAVMMILTHEASLFLFVPAIIGMIPWTYGAASRRGWLYAALLFLTAAATFLTMLHFRIQLLETPGALEQLNQNLRALDPTGDTAPRTDYLRTLNLGYWEHVKSVWNHFFREKFSLHQLAVNIVSFILMLPAFAIVFMLWKNAWKSLEGLTKTEKLRYILLFLSCFGGLAMFVVAHDYIRWCSAIMTCNIAALLLVYSDPRLPLDIAPNRLRAFQWACVSLFYLCMDPPNAVTLPIAEIIAYPIYHLCL